MDPACRCSSSASSRSAVSPSPRTCTGRPTSRRRRPWRNTRRASGAASTRPTTSSSPSSRRRGASSCRSSRFRRRSATRSSRWRTRASTRTSGSTSGASFGPPTRTSAMAAWWKAGAPSPSSSRRCSSSRPTGASPARSRKPCWRSSSRSGIRRTGCSSSTSTRSTWATARSASRRRPGCTSASRSRISLCPRPRCSPRCLAPRATTRPSSDPSWPSAGGPSWSAGCSSTGTSARPRPRRPTARRSAWFPRSAGGEAASTSSSTSSRASRRSTGATSSTRAASPSTPPSIRRFSGRLSRPSGRDSSPWPGGRAPAPPPGARAAPPPSWCPRARSW